MTSPDADLNSDARDYFTRHMRILETCMSAWPMADMQKQIDSLREAFSADVRKPFVLKPSFPYGSPHSASHSTPPRSNASFSSGGGRAGSLEHQLDPVVVAHQPQLGYVTQPISPPISAGPVEAKSEPPPVGQHMGMVAPEQGVQGVGSHAIAGGMPMADTAWDPARLFA